MKNKFRFLGLGKDDPKESKITKADIDALNDRIDIMERTLKETSSKLYNAYAEVEALKKQMIIIRER